MVSVFLLGCGLIKDSEIVLDGEGGGGEQPEELESAWGTIPESPAEWLFPDADIPVDIIDLAAFRSGEFVLAGRLHGKPEAEKQAVLAKYSTNFEHLWTGEPSSADSAILVEVDANDDILVILETGHEKELAKYSDMGELLWRLQLPISSARRDIFLGTNSSGESVVLERNGAIARIDAGGSLLWATELSLEHDVTFHDISIGNEGKVFVAGSMPSLWTAARPKGSEDPWVAALGDEGKIVWSKSFETAANDSFKGIVVTQEGNPTVVGSNVEGLTVEDDGYRATTLIQLSPEGEVLFDRGINLREIEPPYDLTIGANGDIWVVSGMSPIDAAWGGYVSRWSPQGDLLFGARLTPESLVFSFQVVASAGGHVFFHSCASPGGSQHFIARISE